MMSISVEGQHELKGEVGNETEDLGGPGHAGSWAAWRACGLHLVDGEELPKDCSRRMIRLDLLQKDPPGD